MTKRETISNPEFKKELVRKMRNIAPTCRVEFGEDQPSHLKFRLIDYSGRYRSNLVSIYRSPENLEKAKLIAAIRGAGIPNGGLPISF